MQTVVLRNFLHPLVILKCWKNSLNRLFKVLVCKALTPSHAAEDQPSCLADSLKNATGKPTPPPYSGEHSSSTRGERRSQRDTNDGDGKNEYIVSILVGFSLIAGLLTMHVVLRKLENFEYLSLHLYLHRKTSCFMSFN